MQMFSSFLMDNVLAISGFFLCCCVIDLYGRLRLPPPPPRGGPYRSAHYGLRAFRKGNPTFSWKVCIVSCSWICFVGRSIGQFRTLRWRHLLRMAERLWYLNLRITRRRQLRSTFRSFGRMIPWLWRWKFRRKRRVRERQNSSAKERNCWQMFPEILS